MADIKGERTQAGGGTYRHTWTGLAQSDTGQGVKVPANADRTGQVYGNFNGATVTFEASLVPGIPAAGEWFPVTDLQGNAVSFAVANGEFITENAVWYRPVITGGGGATLLNVIMLSRIK